MREGTPVMRPMVFEYTEDPAAAYLDTQYMLGESLRVSPIFREDGVSEYYLPAGKWTHLLSGEVRDGGCWQKDTYDYFSMPLYVRENTLLRSARRKCVRITIMQRAFPCVCISQRTARQLSV